MRLAMLCWLLSSCGPVLLGEEERQQDAGRRTEDGALGGPAGSAGTRAPDGLGSATAAPGAVPTVVVRIQPVDCGSCFELQAEGAGGLPPYDYVWEDGSTGAQRRVCAQGAAAAASVVARDSVGARSAPQSVRLETATDGSCQPATGTDAGAAPELCLQTPSFEGTPTPNFGLQLPFEAPPWTACTNPAATNAPQIGNDTISVTGAAPPPTDGVTYVSLGEGQQVSQELCSELDGGAVVHLQLDLSRIDISGGTVPPTERVFLEIWGGLAVDCTQRELLWASEALEIGWKTFCVTLRPSGFTTQLTLRGNSDMSDLALSYLLVDNLRPVDACP